MMSVILAINLCEYQNLLTLDERGELESIFARLGIGHNPPVYTACQFADVTDQTRLSAEFNNISPDVYLFFRTQYLSDAQHKKTRLFFTRVFGVTFFIAWLLFIVVWSAFTVTIFHRLA